MSRSKVSKGLYFLILVFTSVLSYIVLSIDKSEVFFYLYDENKYSLLNSVIKIYTLSLIFILILSYRASFYRLRERKDEIGLFIGEGIGKSRLFKILIKENIGPMLRANIFGLSFGIFISEFINLLTIKILRLGIGNHYFTVSLKAILLTLLISFFINSLSTYLATARFYKMSPEAIFLGDFKRKPKKFMVLILACLGVFMYARIGYIYDSFFMLGALSLGFVFAFYLIVYILYKKAKIKAGHVIKTYKLSFGFISLILAFGLFLLNTTLISSFESRKSFRRPADFSLYDDREKIETIKDNNDMLKMIGEIYPVYGYEYQDIDNSLLVNTIKYARTIEDSDKDRFFFEPKFLLRESSFKDIFSLGDFDIKEGEAVALSKYGDDRRILSSYLKDKDLYIEVSGDYLRLKDRVYTANIFSNDVIGVGQMLAVDDRLYDRLIGSKPAFAYNVNLSEDFINTYGFSKGSDMLRDEFIKEGFKYESYIWQAKTTISSITESLYTSLYLGLIFLLSGLAFFAIRIFIVFEKNKDNMLILSYMGLSAERLKILILKIYLALFLPVSLVSLILNGLLLYLSYAPFAKEAVLLIFLLGLGFLLTMGLIFILIGKVSFERIISYEKILIIEDDKNLLTELMTFLENNGYKTDSTDDFLRAADLALKKRPDLIILDINLPGISGFEICKKIKEKSNIPILMLTSRVSLDDELRGLSIGADEYLAKPVDTRRLIVRMEKLLDLFDHFEDLVSAFGLSLELSTNKLSYEDSYIILPQTEADLIKVLIERAPYLVSKDELLEEVWSTKYIDENILQVNITRLRKKLKNLGPLVIYNKRAKGYGLGVEDE